MTQKRLVIAAITWSVGVLLVAYLYRVLFTDPRYDAATNLYPTTATAVITATNSNE